MKRRRPRLALLGSLALMLSIAASSSACTSYGRVGPLFTPASSVDEGYGVIYVYRPKKAWGAAKIFVVTQGDRTFLLNPGAYGALVVPDGPSTFFGDAKPIEVRASHAKPLYVRAEFDSLVDSWAEWKGANWKTEVVDEAEALGDLAELGLAPGGRGRYPNTGTPATSAEPTSAPAASATAAASAPPPVEDLTVDTVYLRDGTAVTGEIIAEDGNAVSLMMKDGHGRAIPRSTIDRIVRRARK